MSFESLGLRAELLSALAAQGFTTPTPIQSGAIPLIFSGCDLLAGAQTGTGKTAAFALPIVQQLSGKIPAEKRRKPRALVLVPTRELAAQVSEQTNNYARRLSLRSTMIYGGVTIQAQIERLHRGVDIVVATPGRLLDHAERGTIDLSRIEFLVLDEADRMLDLGFIDDILKVAEYLPAKRQTLLFSATYSPSIKQLADELLKQPRHIEVARRTITADAVTQAIYEVDKSRKREMLSFLIRKGGWKQVLVFARTRYGADKLTEELLHDNIKCGGHSQQQEPVDPDPHPGGVQTGCLARAGGNRCGGPRSGHRAAAPRGELRSAPGSRRLCASHRPHRPGGRGRGGALPGLLRKRSRCCMAIEKLLNYTIPQQTLAEFPQYASRRSGKIRESKQARGEAKAGKIKEKAEQAAVKATAARRKKAMEERPVPKLGRRKSRTKF